MTEDLRCVVCSGELNFTSKNNFFECTNCIATYENALGVPYFGDFEEEDALGLIEIAANLKNRGKFNTTPSIVEEWEEMLELYHKAPNKSEFIASNALAQSPYLLNRYGEWKEVSALTEDLNLAGKKVLDIGAGVGWDSHRLTLMGAHVTALEYSPLLAESGMESFPNIRWIGGFSHILPFKNQSFDAAFCNAALHHMRDIPAAISEALRVLKPGGTLITTCDSFCPSDSNDNFDLTIFDKEPSVLLGVNEGIPKFSEFVASLKLYPDILEVELYTHELQNFKKRASSIIKILFSQLDISSTENEKEVNDYLFKWNLPRDEKMLSGQSGSLAMKIKLKKPWPGQAAKQRNSKLKPKIYADWLVSENDPIAKIASLMPKRFIDLPFPGKESIKFELLNGWRVRRPFEFSRKAYRRGRWFLRKPKRDDSLVFSIKIENSKSDYKGEVVVKINGDITNSSTLIPNEWQDILIDLSVIKANDIFTVEIIRLDGDDSLEGASFCVQNRRFIAAKSLSGNKSLINGKVLQTARIFAVIPVFNRLHFTETCIDQLFNQTYRNIKVILSDGGSTDETIETISRKYPSVTILKSSEVLWWSGAMAAGINQAIEESKSDFDFILMMNNDTNIEANYVETLVKASQFHNSAVGGLIVDSKDGKILDAGEYINWDNYSFPVENDPQIYEQFRDDVDVLPGRGSLVPLAWIKKIGNVDHNLFPHYLGDYDFFYRLKKAGFRLGVCYEAKIESYIEETGIGGGSSRMSMIQILTEFFSRRSMVNVIDHWRFIKNHAPTRLKNKILVKLVLRVIYSVAFRTRIRPISLIFFSIIIFPIKIYRYICYQIMMFQNLKIKTQSLRADVLCFPELFPSLIRPFVYLLVCPGPIKKSDIEGVGLSARELISDGVIEPLGSKKWYQIFTLKPIDNITEASTPSIFWFRFRTVRQSDTKSRNLFKMARMPMLKIKRTIGYAMSCWRDS